MLSNQKILKNRVLVVSNSSSERTVLQKKLTHEGGFEVEFVSDLDKVTEHLHQMPAGVLLHDWDSCAKEKSCLLHQRIAKMEDFSDLCRLIYAKLISPDIGAVAADTGVDRVITLTNLKLNINEEIKMARSAVSNISDLQIKIRALNRGLHHYAQKDIDKTVGEAFERFPHDPFVRLEYGHLCCRRLKLEPARNIGVELLSANPQNVRAANLLSRVLMKQKKYDESLVVLEKANLLSPKNLDRLLQLGELCIKKGDRKKAKGYYAEAHQAYPEDEQSVAAMATMAMEENNLNEAIALFKNSMSEEVAAGILNNAGIQAIRQNKLDMAERFYTLALDSLKTNKLSPQLYFNLALAKRRAKKYEEALKYLNQALKYNPDYRKARKQIKEIESLAKTKKAG